MNKRQQICIIGGGNARVSVKEFRESLESMTIDYDRLLISPSWKMWLAEQLTDTDVLMPSMPLRDNASYQEWALMFGKVISFLGANTTLIGHSLGGIFLAKYFSDNPPKEKLASLVLVAAPYDDEGTESLADFRLSSASGLVNATKEVHLFYSQDDPVVSFGELAKYQSDLPKAKSHIFKNMAHFNNPDFPELLKLLK